jgi:hypothetical protein
MRKHFRHLSFKSFLFLKIQKFIRTPIPKVELNWECGGSFPHTFLHSWEHEMWLWASFLARTFASPCFGCEPKVRGYDIKHPQNFDVI